MLKNYLKTAWRNIVRHKTYAIINVAGLSIGLASVMLIVLFVRDEVSFDSFHAKAPQLYRLVHEDSKIEGGTSKSGITGETQVERFKTTIPEFDAICRLQNAGELVKTEKEVISEDVFYTDPSIFSMFSFPLKEGNATTALKSLNSVVLSESIAKKYFGNADAVGKVMRISQKGIFEPFIVTAITKETPLNSSIQFKILLPFERNAEHSSSADSWFYAYLNSFVLLRPGANVKAVENKMARVFNHEAGGLLAQYSKRAKKNLSVTYRLQPFTTMHLDKSYDVTNGLVEGSRPELSYILGGIALFILIIACINFINLTLSRSLRRSKEIGVRKVTGSSRTQLIWQFMGESQLLTLLAFVVAVLLTIIALPYFNDFSSKHLQLSYLLNWQNLLCFVLLMLVNVLLSGLYPALVLSGFNPVAALSGKFRISGKGYLSKSLVVLQFCIALLLIVGTIVFQKQFYYLIHKDLGYKADNVVDITLPYDKPVAPNLFKNAFAQSPYILQTAAVSIPFTGWNSATFTLDNQELYNEPYFITDENFIPELKIGVLKGRNFYSSAADSNSCIVNEAFVKKAGWTDNPIGKTVKWEIGEEGKSAMTIVGICKDFNFSSLHSTIQPLLLNKSSQKRLHHLLVKIDPAKKPEALQYIQTIYSKLVTDYPCNYDFLESRLAQQYNNEQHWKQIITTASIMAILISCMGLFGLATLSMEQRVKEIGIRKVLGASTANLSALLSKDFLLLVAIAFTIATPLAWWGLHEFLNNYPYRIQLNLWIFAGAGLLTALLAMATISFQTIKAALANPVANLRSE
ncbi:FtsX-like permease family protein [Mucilaginibacter robiniae]|uniref:FtsX-like permease family protein n=1 Tax=Mucilaginibacter robiniae TaxID=2728022 RepID=A0A7L5E6C7_9SPHI|nr:ABC transporter permease [Mucilaginibacter robiniae]QJD98188.1 FtsX-like permease family protein [Mucilaginibacter robiniae]